MNNFWETDVCCGGRVKDHPNTSHLFRFSSGSTWAIRFVFIVFLFLIYCTFQASAFSYFSCFGVHSSDLVNACSGQGICIDEDICSCFPGFANTNCETFVCGGLSQDADGVCNFHGSCVGPETCQCNSGYTGVYCSLPVTSAISSCQTDLLGTCPLTSTSSSVVAVLGSSQYSYQTPVCSTASEMLTNPQCKELTEDISFNVDSDYELYFNFDNLTNMGGVNFVKEKTKPIQLVSNGLSIESQVVKKGKSLKFSYDADSYILLDRTPFIELKNNFTLSFWVQLLPDVDFSSQQNIITVNYTTTRWSLVLKRVSSNPTLCINVDGIETCGTSCISVDTITNSFSHVVISKSSVSGVRIFVDGIECLKNKDMTGSFSSPTRLSSSVSQRSSIGYDLNSNSGQFHGYIDEFYAFFYAGINFNGINNLVNLMKWKGHGCHNSTYSNNPSLCRGGECIDKSLCACPPQYHGTDCSISTCFGQLSTHPLVCSGYGSCEDTDLCKCNNLHTGNNCSLLVNPSAANSTIYGDSYTLKWKFNHKYLPTNISLGELRGRYNFTMVGGLEFDIGGFVKLNGSSFIDISGSDSPFRHMRNNFVLNLKIRSSTVAKNISVVYHEILHVNDGSYWRLYMSNKREFMFETTPLADKFSIPKKIILTSPPISPTDDEEGDYDIIIKKSSLDGLTIEINGIIAIYDYTRVEDLDKFVDPTIDADKSAIGFNPQTNGNFFEVVLDRLIIWKFNSSSMVLRDTEREWKCQGVEQLNADHYCNYNGICIGSDECRCSEPYHSTVCDFPIYTCFGINGNKSDVCSGRGKCVNYDNCTCNANYIGSMCESVLTLNLTGPQPVCPLNLQGGCSQNFDDSQTSAGYSLPGTLPSSNNPVPCQSVGEFVTDLSICGFSFVRTDFFLKYLKEIQRSPSKMTFYDFNSPVTSNTERMYFLDKNYNFTAVFYNATFVDSFLPGGGSALKLSGQSYSLFSGYSMFTGLGNNFTVAFWLKLTKLGARQTIVSNDDDTYWELFIDTNNVLKLKLFDNSEIVTQYTADTSPFYLSLVKSSVSGLKIVVNKTEVYTDADFVPNFNKRQNQTQSSAIGMSIGSESYFNGLMDNVAIAFFEYMDYHLQKGFYSAVGCFGKNNPNVCNDRGICIGEKLCECKDGYSGDECQYTSCYGINNQNSDVCSGHGYCSGFNNCTCTIGYSGDSCAIRDDVYGHIIATYGASFSLRNLFHNKYRVGNNEIRGLDVFYNLQDYQSANDNGGCLRATLTSGNAYSPYTILYNNFQATIRVLFHSFEGNQTLLDLNNVAGWKLYASGNDLVFETKEGTLKSKNIVLGLCLILPNHLYELQITKSTEIGLLITVDGNAVLNETSITEDLVTHNKGVSYVGDSALDGYIELMWISYNMTEDTPSLWYCNDIRYDNPDVCSGKGLCLGRNVCECVYSEGLDCSVPFCFNVSANNISVCSGHGDCHRNDECKCDLSFTGLACQIDTTLLYIHNENGTVVNSVDPQTYLSMNNLSVVNETRVCNTFEFPSGSCQTPDAVINPTVQECLSSVAPSAICKQLILDANVAANTTFNITVCEEGYYQDPNNTYRCKPMCFGVNQENQTVCSGHGICKHKNLCFCYDGFHGYNCQTDTNYTNFAYQELSNCGQDTYSMGFTRSAKNSSLYQLAASNVSMLDSNVPCAFTRRTVNDFAIAFNIYLTNFDNNIKKIISINNLANWCLYLQGTSLFMNGTRENMDNEQTMLTPMIETVNKWYQVLVVKSSSLGMRVYLDGKKNPDYIFEQYDDYISIEPSQNTDSSVAFSPLYGYVDELMIFGVYGMLESDLTVIAANRAVFKCFGNHMNSSKACHGNGVCNGFDICVCNSNFSGPSCSYPVCFGLPSNDAKVCYGNGVCTGPGVCECRVGFIGSQCQNEISKSTCTDPEGKCGSNNATEYIASKGLNFTTGIDCTTAKTSDEMYACGYTISVGLPVFGNISTCRDGYYGPNCSLSICFGILSEDPNVCNGNGNCTKPDFCTCTDSSVIGKDCGLNTTFLQELYFVQKILKANYSDYTFRLKITSEFVSHTSGQEYLKELGGNLTIQINNMVLNNNSISFRNGSEVVIQTKRNLNPLYMFTNDFYISFKLKIEEFTEYNPIMNFTSGTSFSVYLLGTTLVVEGHTADLVHPFITSVPGEIEVENELYSILITKSSTTGTQVYINGVLRYSTAFSYDFVMTLPHQAADSFIGFDIKEGKKIILSGYIDELQIGSNDGLTSEEVSSVLRENKGHYCGGIYLTSNEVCNYNGKCYGNDVCECNGNYTGKNCDIPICFGISGNHSQVCSGHGHCEKPDNCACVVGFIGKNCQTDTSKTTCPDPNVKCTTNDPVDYFLQKKFDNDMDCTNPQTEAEIYLCAGKPLPPPLLSNINLCKRGYYGPNCSLPICFGIHSDDPNVCYGNGNCTKPDFCRCFNSTFSRRDCGVNNELIQELIKIQNKMTQEFPDYSFRLKLSPTFVKNNTDQNSVGTPFSTRRKLLTVDSAISSDESNLLEELGGSLKITIVDMVLSNGTISFANGSGLIISTTDTVSPLYTYTNDFYIAFKITVREFKDYNPIMKITSGSCFSVYMTGTTLVIEGSTVEFTYPIMHVIPNAIEFTDKVYSVIITKSFEDGTQVYINGNQEYTSVFSYSYLATLPNKTDSYIGMDFKDGMKVTFAGTIDDIQISKIGSKNSSQILEAVNDQSAYSCNGIYLTSTEGCNNNGKCFGNNLCECNSIYTGKYCDIPICFGIPASFKPVCSNHGICEKPDTCACEVGFIGKNCQTDLSLTTCTDPEGNCSSLGNGTIDSELDCSNPMGDDVYLCGGKSFPTPLLNVSICGDGYYGPNCSLPICFGIHSDDPNVCNGNGNCTKPDFCKCFNSTFIRNDCGVNVEFLKNVSNVQLDLKANPITSFRLMISPISIYELDGSTYIEELGSDMKILVQNLVVTEDDLISFKDGTQIILKTKNIVSIMYLFTNDFYISFSISPIEFTQYNPIMNIKSGTCFSIYLEETTLVIKASVVDSPSPITILIPNEIELIDQLYDVFIMKSSKYGTQVYINNKRCYTSVFSYDFIDTLADTSRDSYIGFDILEDGTNVGFSGTIDQIEIALNEDVPPEGPIEEPSNNSSSFTCAGISLKSPNVCNGNGKCTGYNICVCNTTHTGKYCDIPTCFGIPASFKTVCSKHGVCEKPDTCACAVGFIGKKCQTDVSLTTCTDPEGNCSSNNASKALGNGTLDSELDCSNPIGDDVYLCGGKSFPTPLLNVSICGDGYYGPNCSLPICFGIHSDDPNVCNGNGNCTKPDFCKCFNSTFIRNDCGVNVEFLKNVSEVQLDLKANPITSFRLMISPMFIYELDGSTYIEELGSDMKILVQNLVVTEDDLISFKDGTQIILKTKNIVSIMYLFTNDFYISFSITPIEFTQYNPIMNIKSGTCFSIYLEETTLVIKASVVDSPSPITILIPNEIELIDQLYDVFIMKSSKYGTQVYINNKRCYTSEFSYDFIDTLADTSRDSYIGFDILEDGTNVGFSGTIDQIEIALNENIPPEGPIEEPSNNSSSFTCAGISLKSPNVCNGNGKCTGYDICVCNTTHTGKLCDIPICFGIPASFKTVCSNHGICEKPDTCACAVGFIGKKCQTDVSLTTCTDPEGNCSSNNASKALGNGTLDNRLDCSNPIGDDVYLCGGKPFPTPLLNVSICRDGYYGPNCSLPICFGIHSDDPNVCNGNGNCTKPDFCKCFTSAITGINCQSDSEYPGNKLPVIEPHNNTTITSNSNNITIGDNTTNNNATSVNFTNTTSGNFTNAVSSNFTLDNTTSSNLTIFNTTSGNFTNNNNFTGDNTTSGNFTYGNVTNGRNFTYDNTTSGNFTNTTSNLTIVNTTSGNFTNNNATSVNFTYGNTTSGNFTNAVSSNFTLDNTTSSNLTIVNTTSGNFTYNNANFTGFAGNNTTNTSSVNTTNPYIRFILHGDYLDTSGNLQELGYRSTAHISALSFDGSSYIVPRDAKIDIPVSHVFVPFINDFVIYLDITVQSFKTVNPILFVSDVAAFNIYLTDRVLVIEGNTKELIKPEVISIPDVIEVENVSYSILITKSSVNGTTVFVNNMEVYSSVFSRDYMNSMAGKDTGAKIGYNIINGDELHFFGQIRKMVIASLKAPDIIDRAFTCGGVFLLEPTVCNGNGKCYGLDACTCNSNYTGSKCSTPICFGFSAEDKRACSGNGLCEAPNTCACRVGFIGANCSIDAENSLCKGNVDCDLDNPSSHLNKTNNGTIDVGGDCSNPKTTDEAMLCGSTGITQKPSVTNTSLNTCKIGYYGTGCKYPLCFGVQSQDKKVCSGHGTCSKPDFCKCRPGFSGNNCQVDNSHVAKIKTTQTTTLEENPYYRLVYTPHTRFISYNTSLVNSNLTHSYNSTNPEYGVLLDLASHVNIMVENPAFDNDGYLQFGRSSAIFDILEDPSPLALFSDDFSLAFNIRVQSLEGIQPIISLKDGAYWKVFLDGSSLVIQGISETSLSPITLTVEDAIPYTGLLYSITIIKSYITTVLVNGDPRALFGGVPEFLASNPSLISESFVGYDLVDDLPIYLNGTVESLILIRIDPINFSGIDSSLFTCFGISQLEPSVCSKHGDCFGGDRCVCTGNYTGEECETPLCFGISAEDENLACSGRGYCSAPDTCECKPPFVGSACQVDSSKTTCNTTDGVCTTDNAADFFSSTNSTPTLSCAPFCSQLSSLPQKPLTSVSLRDGDRIVFALADQPVGYPRMILEDKVVIDRDSLFQMVMNNATVSKKGALFNGENSFLAAYLNSPFDIKSEFSYTFVLSFDNTSTKAQPIVSSNFYLEKTPYNSIKYVGYLNVEKTETETLETGYNVVPSDNSIVAVTLVKSKKNGITIYINGLPSIRLPTTLSLIPASETYFGFNLVNSSSLNGYFKFVALVAGAFSDKQAIQDFADYTTCFGISTLSPDVCSGHGICVYTDNCECKKGYVSDDCSLVATSQVYDFDNLDQQGLVTSIMGYLVQETDNLKSKLANEQLECDNCVLANGLNSNNSGVYFNGISSKIDIAHDSNMVFFYNDFTVTLWLKKEKKDGNSTEVIIYMGSPSYWQLVAIEESSGFTLGINDQYTTRTVTGILKYNLYYFISITKDSTGNGLSVCINNAFSTCYTDADGTYTWRRTIDVHIMSAIGYNPSTRGSYLTGHISKLRFDSAVLSALAINSTISIENSPQSLESRFIREGPVCNGIQFSSNSTQCSKLNGVDNSGGECIEFNNCTCYRDYYGEFCQDFTCDGIMNTNVLTCNGNGTCVHADKCKCFTGWSGLYCSYPRCYELNSTHACNISAGWGVCTSVDTCTCNAGYTGERCQYPICNGIPDYDTNRCSSHGKCKSHDKCECDKYENDLLNRAKWTGDWCEIPKCFFIDANDTTKVCSSHGKCVDLDTCVCDGPYFGMQCELSTKEPIQKTVLFNSSISNNGRYLFGEGLDNDIVVVSFDNKAYGYGTENRMSSKMALSVRKENILGKNGIYQPFDRLLSNNFTITLTFEIFGSLLKTHTLFHFGSGSDWKLIFKNNSLLLEYNFVDGVKSELDIPFTLSPHTVHTISVSKSTEHGISLFVDGTRKLSNTTLVEDWRVRNVSLNKHKQNTIGFDADIAEANMEGAMYSLYFSLGEALPDNFLIHCNGKSGNDTTVCSGFGVCEFNSTCSCDQVHDGIDCEFHKCFNISSQNNTVCHSHGSCVAVNTCNCSSEYGGSECQYPICYGVTSDKQTVCSSSGACVGPNICDCKNGFYGSNCEIPMCYGFLANDSMVCSSNGECISLNTCICNSTFTGDVCSVPICYGFNASDSRVCSSKGVCIAPDTCFCNNNTDGVDCSIITCGGLRLNHPEVCGRIGQCIAPDVCEYYSCYGVQSTVPEVCNSKGLCIGNDVCECESNYFGNNCQNWTCVVNNISDCSYHGECDYANHCTCSDGYTGDACEISRCFNILSNDSSVCSGNGKCVAKDSCNCEPTYSGENCSIPICFGSSSVDLDVCSSHGSCGSPDNCSCELGFFERDCSLTTCFGVVSNQSTSCGRIGKCVAPDVCEYYSCYGVQSNETDTACSSRGLCIGNDVCECESNYFGNNCQNWTCVVNNISDCSYHGECDYANHCTCSDGYTGDACEISRCFNILSNDSSVCASHGNCIDTDFCACSPAFVGTDCSIPICFSFNSTDPNVCSGRGICSSPDTCECTRGFTGPNCEFIICHGIPNNETNVCDRIGKCIAPDICENYTCYGVISNSSAVCSTHGLCIGDNNCECKDDYSGFNCQLWPCIVNNVSNCSYHGECDYANHCTCSDGYTGDACEIPICFSILANNSTACSSHGSCIDRDTCSCNSTHVGFDCSIPICFGFNSTDPNVCSGRGICSSPDTCECTRGFTGPNCEFIICHGIPNNETNVCDRIGKCIAPDICENYTCYGVISNSSAVCSTHGLCIGDNNCECKDDYSGFSCQLWPCIVNNVSNCSYHGECDYANHCTCSDGYTGDACEISRCFNILSNDSSACSSHGSCIDRDTCSCDSTHVGFDCSIPICFSFNSTDPNVCSGRGTCSSPDTCECTRGFTGPNCEFIICHGIPNNESTVCNGHGDCTSPDNCDCRGYAGKNCSTPICYGLLSTDPKVCANKGICVGFDTCDWFTCNNKSVNDSQVCSGNGVCISNNTCKCSDGFIGGDCEHAICFSKYGADACDKKGKCIAPNNCSCLYGYEGLECNITSYFDCANRNNCSAHGICISQDVCMCRTGYRGENCSNPICFNKTLDEACSLHGECILPNVCDCKQGFAGKKCEYSDNSNTCSKVVVNSVTVTDKFVEVIALDLSCGDYMVMVNQSLSELGIPTPATYITPPILNGTSYLSVLNYDGFTILLSTQINIATPTFQWKYISTIANVDLIDRIFTKDGVLYGVTIGQNMLYVTTIDFHALNFRTVSSNNIQLSLYDSKQVSYNNFNRDTIKDLNIVPNSGSIIFRTDSTGNMVIGDYTIKGTLTTSEIPYQPTSLETTRVLTSNIDASGSKLLVAVLSDQDTQVYVATKDASKEMKFDLICNIPSTTQFYEYSDSITIVNSGDLFYIINNNKNLYLRVLNNMCSDINQFNRRLSSTPYMMTILKPNLLKISKKIIPLYSSTSFCVTFDSSLPKGSALKAKFNHSEVVYALESPSQSDKFSFQACVITSDLSELATKSSKQPISLQLVLNNLEVDTALSLTIFDNSIKKIEKLSETKLGIYGVFFSNYQVKVKFEYFVDEVLVTKIVDATFVSENYVTCDMVLDDLSNIGFISVQVSSDNGESFSPKSISTYVMYTPSVFTSNTDGSDNSTTAPSAITPVKEEEKSITGILTFLTNILASSTSDSPLSTTDEAIDTKSVASVKPSFIPIISKKTGEITIKVNAGFVNNATKDKCTGNSNQVVKSVIPTSRKFTLLEKRVFIEFAVAKPDVEEATLMEMLINDQTSGGYFSSSISMKNGEKYFNSQVNFGTSHYTRNISTPCNFVEGDNLKLDMKVIHSFSQMDYSEWSSQDYKDWKATLSYTIKDSNGDAVCNSNSFVLPLTYPEFLEKFSHNYTLRLESSVTCADILNKATISIETDLYNMGATCKVQKCVAHATLLPNMESADMTIVLVGAISGGVAIMLFISGIAIAIFSVWYYRRKKMRSSKYTVYDYAHNRDDLQDAMNDLFDKMNSSDEQLTSSTATTNIVIPEFEDEDPSLAVNTYAAWK